MILVSNEFKAAFSGPIDRTKIKVEVYFSALLGWVDVTPWVESMSGSQEELSALTGGTSANTLSVVFINDDGRFSRKNTASPYYASGLGLVPNKPIRVSAVWGGESVRMFTGNTGPWNTGAKARTCSISAQDPARLMRDREVEPEILMDPANPGVGYYLTRVIERAAWLAGLRWDAVTTKAAAWTSTAHGGTITPTYDAGAPRATYTQGGALVMALDFVDLSIPVAELKGKALELLSKLAEVAGGTIYFDAQGQLVFRSRMYRNDSTIPVAETFTVSNLEDVTAQANFESSQFAPLINKATVTSTPLAPVLDAAGNWTEQEIVVSSFVKTEFDTAEKYPDTGDPDLFIAFPDGIRIHREPGYPSATNVTLRSSYSEDTTRELNGIGFTGGTPVFFPESVKVAFENLGTGKERLKELVLRVKHFKAVQGCRGSAENAESQGLYGQRAADTSNDFIPSTASCEVLAAWKVEDGREVKDFLTLPVMYGLPWLEINDRIKVSETISRTVPTEEEFIVKRIAWSWTLAGFLFSVEACTPSPSFSAGSLPPTATITETANVNLSAAVKGGLPPQAIDGTQNLIGMTDIPAFWQLTASSRSLTNPTISSAINGMAFYRGYLWAVSSDGYIWKIDPLTMQSVNQWRPDAASAFIDCEVYGQYLYIADSKGGYGPNTRIVWFDMDNPGTTLNTHWGVKVALGSLAANPLTNPRFLLIRGTKLYIHAKEYFDPVVDNDSRMAVVDVASTATVTSVEANVETNTGSYDSIANDLMFAGGYIWAVARDSRFAAVLASAVSAGASVFTVDTAAGLQVGQPIQVGSNDWTWIQGISGNTVTVSPPLANSHAIYDGVYPRTTTIAKFDPATNTVVDRFVVYDGHDGQGVEWDGSILWVSFRDRVVGYRLVNGELLPLLIHTAPMTGAGSLRFDGAYLWWARQNVIKQLDAKSGLSLAEFSDGSAAAGLLLFDGRSVFRSGSNATVYQIPRWSSTQS